MLQKDWPWSQVKCRAKEYRPTAFLRFPRSVKFKLPNSFRLRVLELDTLWILLWNCLMRDELLLTSTACCLFRVMILGIPQDCGVTRRQFQIVVWHCVVRFLNVVMPRQLRSSWLKWCESKTLSNPKSLVAEDKLRENGRISSESVAWRFHPQPRRYVRDLDVCILVGISEDYPSRNSGRSSLLRKGSCCTTTFKFLIVSIFFQNLKDWENNLDGVEWCWERNDAGAFTTTRSALAIDAFLQNTWVKFRAEKVARWAFPDTRCTPKLCKNTYNN